jgi:hypothetical protein
VAALVNSTSTLTNALILTSVFTHVAISRDLSALTLYRANYQYWRLNYWNLTKGIDQMHRPRKLQTLDWIVSLLATLILIVFWLIVATFPDFFLFNPFHENDALRRYELLASTIGWIGISTLTPITLYLFSAGYHRARYALPVLALVYPTALVTSQITVYNRTGSTYLSYLWNYPVFIFTDLLLPIFILFIWHDLKERKAVASVQ